MQSQVKTYQDDPVIQKKRWIILIVLNLFVFMSTLDGSIVNIALPSISKDLNLPIAQSEWIVSGYILTICSIILFFGRLGDIVGKINMFKLGCIIFIFGSLLCGFSNSLTFLLTSRIIQAIGASMTMANNQGIITEIFPAKHRGKALGLLGTFVSLGSITGPSLGGFMVSSLGWQSIFWVNVPIGLMAIILGWMILPKDMIKLRSKLDITGSVLFALSIISLFTGLLLGQQVGYTDLRILAAFFAGVVLLVFFIYVEIHKEEPMITLSIFKNPLFSLSIFCGFLVFVSNFCFNIVSPFYTQDILLLSPSHAGLVLMLFPVTMVIVAPLSGALSDKIGSELLTFAGLIMMVVAQFGLAGLHQDSDIWLVCVWVALLGISCGLFQSPNNSLVMSTVRRTQLGIAGSINALVRNLGMVVGISSATSILFSVMSREAGYRVTALIPHRPDIFLDGMHIVFLSSASVCLLGALLTGWRLYHSKRSRRKQPNIHQNIK
ncbi:MFS transporter [Terrilactibacillus laevilacticus]|uniref:MFS transporter n=1 Tax=Terrilactibacillus laevilacticus TaxID=1380157 RepID=UPI001147468D|nr:MFS transporter [Terrilactibacillus laevilacticus]